MQSSTPVNEQELNFSKDLYAAHYEAATILDATVGTLARWASEFYSTEPALGRPLAEQLNLSDDTICSVAFTIVGNQHKWDRLGPEKIIIMKSCVGAP